MQRLGALGVLPGGARPPVGVDVGEQLGRQEQHGAHTAVRGPGVHRDAEAVPRGQQTHHGEAELRRVAEPGDVHRALAGEQVGGPLDLQTVHAHTGVVDHDASPVVHRLEADLHRGVGLRVAGGVVQQLGDREHGGLHGPAHHGDVDQGVHLNPLVVADARLGAADHIGQRGGQPLPAGPGAAEHGDGLGAPAELGVGVVDLQQVPQHIGVVVPLLHLGDGDLLLVGESLDGSHGRLERRLGGGVGARLRPVHRPGELLHDGVQTLREGRTGQLLVAQARQRAGLAQRVGDRGEAYVDEVAHLLVTGAQAVLERGVAPADSGGDLPLADQKHQDDEKRDGQTPAHRLRYVISHQEPRAGETRARKERSEP
ncbi:hypothetical protein SVIO_078700 [Streptomyces violaceusniger]|uniref:Uncharacterized protein n=1 Tax=Streptomyces violaceusniger TaxID=68280 RepID=A0A4D4LFI6_STRVO|nr:hypothetical protein SVIO_078700 [Streptomyces violaceusniger]